MMDGEDKAMVWIVAIMLGSVILPVVVGIIADAYIRTH